MSDGWPFDESLEQILDLSTWSVTTEVYAAPPELAAKMRAANVIRAQSETAIPLTTGALTRLISEHWPSPAAERLAALDERCVTFRWLNFLFVVYDNLYIEQHQITLGGVAIRSDLWPKTNAATRTFERILQRGLEGNPVKISAVDEEGARALIEAEPDTANLYWRGSRVGHGEIGLCARHARQWPEELGPLRLCVFTPQLLAHLASSSAATIRSAARDIFEWYSGRRPRGCRGCRYEQEYRSLGPYHGLDRVGPDLPGHGRDDGRGPLAHAVYGQPLVVISDDPALQPFTCERCQSVKPRTQGTPCEGCGKGSCLVWVGENPRCDHCGLCTLCGASEGEQHDPARHGTDVRGEG